MKFGSWTFNGDQVCHLISLQITFRYVQAYRVHNDLNLWTPKRVPSGYKRYYVAAKAT